MNSKTPLILLIGLLVVATLAAIVIIILRAPSTADQLTLIGAIVAFMAPLLTAVIALIRSETANGKANAAIQQVQNHVDNPPGTA